MAELDPRARALLERARPAFSPRPDELERLRERLRFPGSPGSDGGASPPPTAPWKGPWKLVLALCVGTAIGGGALVSVVSRQAPLPLAGPIVQTPRPPSASVSHADWHPAIWSMAEPLAEPPPHGPRRAKRAPTARSSSAADPLASASLAAELELITAARRALRERRFAQTQLLCARYLERFGAGTFREEAEVLALLAKCQESPGAPSRALARAHLAHASGRFSDLVRHTCLLQDE